MNPIKFHQQTHVFAENQPEFLPLPAAILDDGRVISCWKLSDEEIAELSCTKKLWLIQSVGFSHIENGVAKLNALQAQLPMIESPFVEELKFTDNPANGMEIISNERFEQIHKHGYTIQKDLKFYQKGELIQAAFFCMDKATDWQFRPDGYVEHEWPQNWDEYAKRKICQKDFIGKIACAGAFFMAENALSKTKEWNGRISQMAMIIDTHIETQKRIQRNWMHTRELIERNHIRP